MLIDNQQKGKQDIQDTEEASILFGAYVCALYPSLEQTETAALVAHAVYDSIFIFYNSSILTFDFDLIWGSVLTF